MCLCESVCMILSLCLCDCVCVPVYKCVCESVCLCVCACLYVFVSVCVSECDSAGCQCSEIHVRMRLTQQRTRKTCPSKQLSPEAQDMHSTACNTLGRPSEVGSGTICVKPNRASLRAS